VKILVLGASREGLSHVSDKALNAIFAKMATLPGEDLTKGNEAVQRSILGSDVQSQQWFDQMVNGFVTTKVQAVVLSGLSIKAPGVVRLIATCQKKTGQKVEIFLDCGNPKAKVRFTQLVNGKWVPVTSVPIVVKGKAVSADKGKRFWEIWKK